MERRGGAYVVVPHFCGRSRVGGRPLRRRRPGRRAVSQPRGALRPQGEPLDQGKLRDFIIVAYALSVMIVQGRHMG